MLGIDVADTKTAAKSYYLRGPALLAQLPLVLLMVAYTFSGLWVLGQALKAKG